jgi:hypothetical protein
MRNSISVFFVNEIKEINENENKNTRYELKQLISNPVPRV